MRDNQTGEYNKVVQAAGFILGPINQRPVVGFVLGSGLGAFANQLTEREILPYAEIPYIPVSAVEGHAGKLYIGDINGVCVAVLCGRAHLYEGWSPAECVFGVRLLAALGVHTVLLTNAAGGINQGFRPGELMVISDHLNLTGSSPLTGPNDDQLGNRFPDMSEAYDHWLRQELLATADRIRSAEPGLYPQVREGVYAQLNGPSYETPAEIRMLKALGADAVGMSTALEAIALRHRGVRVAGVSCITNMAAGVVKGAKLLSHKEVMETSARVSAFFVKLLTLAVPGLACAAE